jgi:hypothetical protein
MRRSDRLHGLNTRRSYSQHFGIYLNYQKIKIHCGSNFMIFDILIFNGMQQRPGKIALPVFTDTLTGTTFMVTEGEEILDALKRKRKQFNVEDKDNGKI